METCHNHDTYFWPDEGCPVCRLSEEVTALRAKLGKFEAMTMLDFANYLTTKSIAEIKGADHE